MTDLGDWFQTERGIDLATLEAWGVVIEGDVAKFTGYENTTRWRKGGNKDVRRFWWDPPLGKGQLNLLKSPDFESCKAAFLVEGETDAMRLWQELTKDGINDVGVACLPGVDTWRKEMGEELPDRTYLILDNEDDYSVAGQQVEQAARQIRFDLGRKLRRVQLPHGIQDLCEFFDTYDLEMLKLEVKRGSTISRFKPLDLTKQPPPPNWLLEGLIARGDCTILAGAESIGKSWVTMGLCVATADAHDSFLGADMRSSGRVLYVDEENPEDVVYSRLEKLGLTTKSKEQNVRYLWNNGIRLDTNPEVLIDEALDFEPTLIIIDSLTRVHTKAENDAGEMSALFNQAAKPLARETGAAVVIIHHHDKGGFGPRGSGDITAAADGVLNVYRTGEVPGQFRVKLSKSRRRLAGDDMLVRISDMPDGSVRLLVSESLESPF